MMQVEIICAHRFPPPDVNFDEYVQTEDASHVTSQSGCKKFAVKSGEVVNHKRESMFPGGMCLNPFKRKYADRHFQRYSRVVVSCPSSQTWQLIASTCTLRQKTINAQSNMADKKRFQSLTRYVGVVIR